ncbi:hypothetical protein SDC9_169327 [bioreactor metagenome]|uniref:Uncharacterized protein n=1 Tax=bioreactor metagenome TaxID=1076179 RepID=A0A645G5M1_9ZZZZ
MDIFQPDEGSVTDGNRAASEIHMCQIFLLIARNRRRHVFSIGIILRPDIQRFYRQVEHCTRSGDDTIIIILYLVYKLEQEREFPLSIGQLVGPSTMEPDANILNHPVIIRRRYFTIVIIICKGKNAGFRIDSLIIVHFYDGGWMANHVFIGIGGTFNPGE